MTTIIAYIVLCMSSASGLETAVNQKLVQGYIPEGGISISPGYHDGYCQAMDKFAEQNCSSSSSGRARALRARLGVQVPSAAFYKILGSYCRCRSSRGLVRVQASCLSNYCSSHSVVIWAVSLAEGVQLPRLLHLLGPHLIGWITRYQLPGIIPIFIHG